MWALRRSVGMAALIPLFLSGCGWARQSRPDRDAAPVRMERALANVAPDRGQLLVAIPLRAHSSQGILYAFDHTDSGWALHAGPVKIMVGRNGFAKPGEKREGDGHNPAGLFPLEFAFGYAPSIHTRMPYRQATEDDLWVDDDKSPDYNQWVRRGRSSATSFEEMKRSDSLYRLGLVIGYNRNPVVAGRGSAIFAHVWREEVTSTAGCIAMAESDLVNLLAWLEPVKKPMILMGDPHELAVLPGMAELANSLPTITPTINEQMVLEKGADATDRHVEYTASDGFMGIAAALPPRVAAGMVRSGSWREGCPVPLRDLSYLVLTYRGFDNKSHAGELVVHRKLALPVVKAFAELFTMKFPLERMELIEAYNGSDDKSMAANNTSAFNCRDVAGKPGVFSKHSYGAAIDINPVQNPYLLTKADELRKRGWSGSGEKVEFIRTLGYGGDAPVTTFCRENPDGCLVLPPNSASYLDRSVQRAGMLRLEEPAVRAFVKRSFTWGGAWQNTPDYQHVEYDVKKLLP